MSEHRAPAAWRPIASFSVVVIMACALFFVLYLTLIAPRFLALWREFGTELPQLVQLAVKPITPIAALCFLIGGTVAGVLRPKERAIILSLTAGAGLSITFALVILIFVPMFTLAIS